VPLAAATAATALLHAVLPTHWLPLAAISRAQRWSGSRLAAIAALAATGHALVTGAVGFAVALGGAQLTEHLEVGEKLAAGILIAFGALYAIFDLRHLGHRHMHHVHDGHVHDSHHHDQGSSFADRASVATYVVSLAISPCVALTAVFLDAGGIGGLPAAGVIAGVNIAVTVPAMTVMVLLAARGLSTVRLERFEGYERAIVGFLLVAMGIAVLLIHHDH
jgi:nickel/cobalt exporter